MEGARPKMVNNNSNTSSVLIPKKQFNLIDRMFLFAYSKTVKRLQQNSTAGQSNIGAAETTGGFQAIDILQKIRK
jgi:hypothetical protein